ncbi:MAG: 3-hydroxybutyryl-CoA dehydrogenase [Ignavibacteria bacterium]|nr:3-hydroxybutyryl-CoA dehydrogenase [Ignavibacteria bacterium]
MAKVKRLEPQAGTRRRTDSSGRASIYIVGESPMVEEFAELCAGHGYQVHISWNETPESIPPLTSKKITRGRIIPSGTSLALELTTIDLDRKRENLQRLDKALPPTAAIVSTSVTVTATEQSTWVLNRNRLVGMGALPTLIDKPIVEIAPTVFSPKETVEVVQRFFRSLGKEMMLVQDRVGLVFPRILCHVINEASFALQEQVATPQDLDMAMKLGAGFPLGPIEWADRIGLKHVHAVLSALQNDLQEERYRISPLLRQLAQGGVWWKHGSGETQERSER